MSLPVPVRMVTSINRLLSHTVNRLSKTCTMPIRMRAAVFSLMPAVCCQSHLAYFISPWMGWGL